MSKQSNKFVLLALVAAFALPFLLAWGLYLFGDISGQGRNHGQLILPPRTLQDVELFDAYRQQPTKMYGKWNMLYIHQGGCAQTCQDNLYKMRQIRLATNKYAHRLQRVLLLDNNTPELYQQALTDPYRGQLLLFKDSLPDEFMQQFILADEEQLPTGRLYIIDPIGNLMMAYAADADPKGIIEDLIHLIKISRIG